MKSDYCVKVRECDNHHRKTIEAINELHEEMSAGKGKEAQECILSDLTNYVMPTNILPQKIRKC
ncbi:MAG: hypothetical protein H8D23_19405 [Candidatus Brocadiales bacterium]|nr:hypothetical protein [Candidatus Brocadiales bacterium]